MASPDTKPCPDCAEQVNAEAKVCRFCGYRSDRVYPERVAFFFWRTEDGIRSRPLRDYSWNVRIGSVRTHTATRLAVVCLVAGVGAAHVLRPARAGGRNTAWFALGSRSAEMSGLGGRALDKTTRAKLLKLARRFAGYNGDSTPHTVMAVQTTHKRAGRLMGIESQRPPAGTLVSLIAMRGRFACNECKTPSGGSGRRYKVLMLEVVASTMNLGATALQDSYPDLRAVGTPVLLEH